MIDYLIALSPANHNVAADVAKMAAHPPEVIAVPPEFGVEHGTLRPGFLPLGGKEREHIHTNVKTYSKH